MYFCYIVELHVRCAVMAIVYRRPATVRATFSSRRVNGPIFFSEFNKIWILSTDFKEGFQYKKGLGWRSG
jgi:hypothetical protein